MNDFERMMIVALVSFPRLPLLRELHQEDRPQPMTRLDAELRSLGRRRR